MTEPDVALTDFGLTLECAVFAAALWGRREPNGVRPWLVLFFAAAAVAALAGGVVHGFYSGREEPAGRGLWLAALLAVGAAALAGWAISGRLALTPRAARAVTLAAWAQLALYAALLLSGHQTFLVAILEYLPAALCLLAAVAWRARRGDLPGAVPAALGLAITLVAPVVQQARVDLDSVGLTHNSLYHLVQAVGFALFFAGSRRWVAAAAPIEEVPC